MSESYSPRFDTLYFANIHYTQIRSSFSIQEAARPVPQSLIPVPDILIPQTLPTHSNKWRLVSYSLLGPNSMKQSPSYKYLTHAAQFTRSLYSTELPGTYCRIPAPTDWLFLFTPFIQYLIIRIFLPQSVCIDRIHQVQFHYSVDLCTFNDHLQNFKCTPSTAAVPRGSPISGRNIITLEPLVGETI